jgi:MFS family permease
MEESTYRAYAYRWVILAAFMLVVAMNQLSWITFAPITRDAATFYGVSDLAIGLLSLVFMAVFIVMSLPASWVIDTYGIRAGVGIGAVLTGGCALLRGLLPAGYSWVLAAQIGLAVGQPFVLNAITKVAARWFPARERATAAGLATLAIYVGILIGLAATPVLVTQTSIPTMLTTYGAAAAAVALLFFVLVRERPPSPAGEEERSLVLDGLKTLLRDRKFQILLVLFLVGLGTFNAVTTWIEDIVRPRGLGSAQAGLVGGLMVAGGVIGAAVFPLWSDRLRRRVPFILLALGGAIVGLLGLTLARSYGLILISAIWFGAFLLSSGPIGFQYAAEITHPVPEGTSNGLLLMMGQISGIVFILAMDALRTPSTGAMTPSLLALVGLLVVGLALATRLREPSRLPNR